MKRLLIFLMVFGMLFVFSSAAYSGGQVKLAAMDVSAYVLDYCTLTTTPVEFGEYDDTADVLAEGHILLNCSSNVHLTMAIGGGGCTTSGMRCLQGPGDTLAYDLYQDNTYGPIWGGSAAGFGSSKQEWYDNEDDHIGPFHAWTVWGKLPAQGSKADGIYQDTVGIIVEIN